MTTSAMIKKTRPSRPIRCAVWIVERMRYRPTDQPTDGHSQFISDKTVPRRESLNFFISWLFKLFLELVSSFFIFLNILIIAKVEAISLPKIIFCQEAARPRQKNQRFIYVNQRSRQGGDVIFCHYFVILCHHLPALTCWCKKIAGSHDVAALLLQSQFFSASLWDPFLSW